MTLEAAVTGVLAISLSLNAYFLKQLMDRLAVIETRQDAVVERLLRLEWLSQHNGGRNAS